MLAQMVVAAGTLCAGPAMAQEKLHFTYLWHLEQPVYWPDRQATGADRYETAWGSIQRKDGGAGHPADNLRQIFGLDDRIAAYQWRVRDSIERLLGQPEAGAQVSYSGGLIENVSSLGAAGQLGYSAGWSTAWRQARGWTTTGGRSRCDLVLFSFHHALLPLLDESAVRKEIRLYRQAYAGAWGAAPGPSRGFFPSEMAFSARLIGVLAEEGVAWALVSGEKLSRACADFPVVYGSGGVNCDPPNRADQVNPAQGDYYRVSISRGCGPAEAYPFAFTPHRARHVNPETGAVSSIIVVPCSQSLGWKDGYAPLGLSDFNALQARNDPARPMLVVLAHDGDNAWGGGYSYYLEATPQLVSSAASAGYMPTVVEKYLADHPVPAGDVVHVEDGAWVNADGDFGAPQFLNWNWPPLSASGQVDIAGGWHVDIRNWAVITAAQNRVDTAEQIAGPVRMDRVLSPGADATGAERAWHYFLGALNSGFMYYGTPLDHEVKQAVACNEAARCADPVIGAGTLDATPPTVWIPQRYPWNPGAVNFGPQHGYQQKTFGPEFDVWTFAYDVSGVAWATLKYRVDADGVNPLASTQNETYAGGSEVGAWQPVAMTRRAFPAGNVYGDPSIDFFEMPLHIAEQFTGRIPALPGKLVDYYVEASDARGFIRRSPIQHVYVGTATGGGGGEAVAIDPSPAVAGGPVQVAYNPAGRPLAAAPRVFMHYGFNGWGPVISPDPEMTWDAAASHWRVQVPVITSATQLDLVFNDGQGLWDNNGGQDWHFPVTGASGPPWVMDGVLDAGAQLLAEHNGMKLWAGLRDGVLYVACPDAGEGNDHFILLAETPGALRSAMWAKAGRAAQWAAFLADENDNDFEAWFDAGASREAATGPNGGVLEGAIDLAGELGHLPESIALAVAAYPTGDGAGLVASAQVPASLDGDGDVNSGEFLMVKVCELGLTCCPPDLNGDGVVDFSDYLDFLNLFEALDPAVDFNRDGLVDFADYLEFLNLYESGC